jgi:hypothetical protein
MKTRATILAALAGCLLPVRGPAQSTVPWSAVDMGYAVSSSAVTIVRSVVGQAFVGVMQGTATVIESGFLVDTLLRTTVTSVAGPAELPREYALRQNYPNPFNPSTTIRVELPHSSRVSLKVYDALGQEVATLVDEEKAAGVHDVRFDAGNLASGMYVYRLYVRISDPASARESTRGVGDFVAAKRLLLLK